ncbi:MAG: hypothetical protein ABEI07_00960 [Candidatus Nanohaloarchaea archaeon]
MFSAVLTFVDAAWKLSIQVLPFFYLGFLAYALYRGGGLVEEAVESQYVQPLHFGPYLLAGILAGSVFVLAAEGIVPVILGGLTALSACVYGYKRKGEPGLRGTGFEGLELLKAAWLIVPVLSAGAIVLQSVLLKSLVAVVFYSTVFWEV